MIAILAYHSIGDTQYTYAVRPAMFERQLRYVQKKFRIIRLDELRQAIASGTEFHEPVALVTFDDGFKDNMTHALPILRKLAIPAVIFATTGHIGMSGFLSSDDIAELTASGLVDIQNHTHTHAKLTALSVDEVAEEFSRSQAILAAHTGASVYGMAYPKGKYNEEVRVVAKQHFSVAFGGNGIIERLAAHDSLALPRITLSARVPFWKFKFMLMPLYWRLKRLVR